MFHMVQRRNRKWMDDIYNLCMHSWFGCCGASLYILVVFVIFLMLLRISRHEIVKGYKLVVMYGGKGFCR